MHVEEDKQMWGFFIAHDDDAELHTNEFKLNCWRLAGPAPGAAMVAIIREWGAHRVRLLGLEVVRFPNPLASGT